MSRDLVTKVAFALLAVTSALLAEIYTDFKAKIAAMDERERAIEQDVSSIKTRLDYLTERMKQ